MVIRAAVRLLVDEFIGIDVEADDEDTVIEQNDCEETLEQEQNDCEDTLEENEQNDCEDTLEEEQNDCEDTLEENEATAQTSPDVACDEGEVNEEMESDMDITELEAYASDCPALLERDNEGYASADEGGLDGEDDVEDAVEILEEIQPYIKMAVSAYRNDSMSGCIDIVESSYLIKNVIDPTHLFGIGKTDTEVHVCILHDQSVVFAFRRTEPADWKSGFGDVLTDLAEGQDPVKLYNGSGGPVYTSQPLIQAHCGFQAALKDVTDTDEPTENLMHVLQEQLRMDAGDVQRVVCVGHSLGGALATLCAKWCREVAFPGAEIGCVTIGSPRVGNVAFAQDFDSRVVDGLSYRVVNKRDVVPCVPNLLSYPMKGSIYKHVSRPIYMCEDEAGSCMRARLGGRRPNLCNLGFFDHPGLSYLKSLHAVLGS